MNVTSSRGVGALLAVALTCGLTGAATAQLGDPLDGAATPSSARRTNGTVTVTSTPSGAIVRLDGQGIHLVGRTPWTISRGLDGVFYLSSHLDVYERSNATVFLSPGSNETIHMDLAPKSPVKAGLRSLLVPGWGQHYSDRGVPGGLYFGTAIAAGALVVATALRYENRVDDLEIAHDAYSETSVQAEREELWLEVERQQVRAESAQSDRTKAWAVLGVVWGVNLLDALFFFPDRNPPIITSSSGSSDMGLYVTPRSDGADFGFKVGY